MGLCLEHQPSVPHGMPCSVSGVIYLDVPAMVSSTAFYLDTPSQPAAFSLLPSCSSPDVFCDIHWHSWRCPREHSQSFGSTSGAFALDGQSESQQVRSTCVSLGCPSSSDLKVPQTGPSTPQG